MTSARRRFQCPLPPVLYRAHGATRAAMNFSGGFGRRCRSLTAQSLSATARPAGNGTYLGSRLQWAEACPGPRGTHTGH